MKHGYTNDLGDMIINSVLPSAIMAINGAQISHDKYPSNRGSLLKKFESAALLLIGAVMGAGIVWRYDHMSNPIRDTLPISLEQVFRHANTDIMVERFSCEGDTAANVGAVIASIYERNALNRLNQTSYLCSGNECMLSVSNCKPWQSSECSSRILKFGLLSQEEIDVSSFTCIDVP